MRIHSIRWRLTFSYAAIACLAALALGTVLLAILRGYYAEKERDYLNSNTQSFKSLVASAMAEQMPVDVLKSQLESLAFFSKTRIRILDTQGKILVDTGVPDQPHVIAFVYHAPGQSDLLLEGPQVQSIQLIPVSEFSSTVAVNTWENATYSQPAGMVSTPVFDFAGSLGQTAAGGAAGGSGIASSGPQAAAGSGGTITFNATSMLPLSSNFYGFEMGGAAAGGSSWQDINAEQDTTQRSGQRVTSDIFDKQGQSLGEIIVSDGPAYGSEIVNSVARGWALAGGIAVLLAAAAGWFVSRQISKPLLALTDITARMTAGDLSTRANVERQDELGSLAASFNTMADRIQETVVTLQRFVADAAHELHTPLTALRTNLELASSDHPSPAVQRAHQQVIRLEKLTDSLLALSRIESQTGAEQAVPIDLAALLRSTSEVYASRAEQAGLDYALSIPAQVPLVLGQNGQFECVISNLVDNAIKFTPPGGTVSLSLQQTGQTLKLVVQDTGIGIPPDDLPLLFERFCRGRNAAHYPGSGLGLAIVKAIIKARGGSIQAESSAGTTITISLPLLTGTTPV